MKKSHALDNTLTCFHQTAASCSVSATTTIQNSGDASGIASCSTFSGSIAIATGTTDDIALNTVKKITGSVTLGDNSAITSFGGDSLEEIGDTLNVSNVQVLQTFNFPKLTSVDSIILTGLPNLRQLGLSLQKAASIDIENTQLTTLDGINVTEATTIKIANNGLLDTIDLPVTSIDDILELSDNNVAVTVTLNDLETAKNLTFRNCSGVTMPNIKTMNGTLAFFGSKFETFNATNLTSITGALTFVDNNNLENISFPALTKVSGALEIANNTELHNIDFPKLETVGGALDFHGNITT